MARIRTIKPEFWDSPGTARASLRARLFFIAMWNWADDYGVGTANGKALIGFAFPNDDEITAKDFPTLRKEVADSFGVMFYEVEGRPYYAIPSWDKHQRTERKARRINPPPPEGVSAGQIVNEGTSAESIGTSDAMHGSSGVGTGEQGNRGTGEEDTCPPADADRRDADSIAADFDIWYDAYPRKEARGRALKAYRAARKKTDAATLLSAVEAQRDYLTRKGREFVPHPTTWLNGERWLDEPPTNMQPQTRMQQGMAVAARLAAEEQSQIGEIA